MIRVSNVKFRPKAVPDDLQAYVAELTGFDNIVFFRIAKKSVDARKKDDIRIVYSAAVTFAKPLKNAEPYERPRYELPTESRHALPVLQRA